MFASEKNKNMKNSTHPDMFLLPFLNKSFLRCANLDVEYAICFECDEEIILASSLPFQKRAMNLTIQETFEMPYEYQIIITQDPFHFYNLSWPENKNVQLLLYYLSNENIDQKQRGIPVMIVLKGKILSKEQIDVLKKQNVAVWQQLKELKWKNTFIDFKRSKKSLIEILIEIKQGSGSVFNPDVVENGHNFKCFFAV